MEFLLLWIDDLDDAVGALRHLAPRILGFAFAAALFTATVVAFSLAPQATLACAGLLSSFALVEGVRRRRIERTTSPQS